MNFENNKKKKILLTGTTYALEKGGGEKLSRVNTNAWCEISFLIKLTAN